MVLIDEMDEDDPSELTTEELRQEVERLRKMVETADLDDHPTSSHGEGLAKFPPNGLGFEDGALAPSRLRTGACVPNHPSHLQGHGVMSVHLSDLTGVSLVVGAALCRQGTPITIQWWSKTSCSSIATVAPSR